MKTIGTKNKFNICVITYPFVDPVGVTLLSNFIDILEPLSDELFVITGKFPDRSNKKIHVIRIKSDDKKELTLIRVIKYIVKQLRITYNLIKISKKISITLFFLNVDVLPILFSKLLGKKTVLVTTGSSPKVSERGSRRLFGVGTIIFPFIFRILDNINFTLSNKIIIYSENLMKEWNLEKYKSKILIAHRHFLDFDKFKIKKKFDDKRNLIGYIGRLSEEKGTLNFVKAIPEISKEKGDLEFLIGGDGQLCDKIKKYLDENNLNDKVNLAGWIPHDKLPDYLNELKLVVLPSYTEGLPNLMLEAMACGTPVLATPVGAIPDVITDGETGFIMENNSPECVAENVIRALNHPNIDEIVKNARELIEEEYTYETAVGRYRKILDEI